MMSSAVATNSTNSAFAQSAAQAELVPLRQSATGTQSQPRHGFDPEDSLVVERRSFRETPMRHCMQEFGSRTGILPRMPMHPEIGAVGDGASACGGAAIGFVVGTILWGALGIPSIAVNHNNRYHSDLRGILFLAIGIPAFTLIGAAIGACMGNGGGKDS